MDKATVNTWPADGSKEREFSVEDALLYLDKIKVSFADTPEVYGEFLNIMKNYKTKVFQTEEVIAQIKSLFSGKQDLIADFHKFLPGELSKQEDEGTKEVRSEGTTSEQRNVVSPSAPAKLQQAHAMNYVIKVRNRFSTQPQVYSAFLQALNTYHTFQRTISEVLEQVSQLFADHPDLLTEFTYFLPDTVQDQAKERMQEAVREAERRRQLMPAPTPTMSPTGPGTQVSANAATAVPGVLMGATSGVPTTTAVGEPAMVVPTLPEHLLLQSTASFLMPGGTGTSTGSCAGADLSCQYSALPSASSLLASTAVPLSPLPGATAASDASAAPAPALASAPAPSTADTTQGQGVSTRGNSSGRKRANTNPTAIASSAKTRAFTNSTQSTAESVHVSEEAPAEAATSRTLTPPEATSTALSALQGIEGRLSQLEALVEQQGRRIEAQASEIAQLKTKASPGRKKK